jgi:hypothetical protein
MEHVPGVVCRLDLGEPPIGTVAVRLVNSAAIIIRIEDVDVDAGTVGLKRMKRSDSGEKSGNWTRT